MRPFITDAFAAAMSIAITAGCVAASAPSAAAVVDAPRQVTVVTSDLDLGAPAGRAVAERRIRRAADAVCSVEGSRFDMDTTCRANAVSQATAALDARIDASADPVTIASR